MKLNALPRLRDKKTVEQLPLELPHLGCGQLLLDRLERITWPLSPVSQQSPPASKPRESRDWLRALNAESSQMWVGELPVDGEGLAMPADIGAFDFASRLAGLRPATRETCITTGLAHEPHR